MCEYCGFDEAAANASHQLPLGTVLKEQYRIGKVLGQGGFGITYIGWDQNLEIPLAIKEYYPNGLVARDCSHSLEVSSSGYASETFQHNRERFLREARALAKLYNIPGIVKIYNYFAENNTAYIVMEYVRGVDLKNYIKEQGHPMTPAETFAVLRPVMEALSKVHEAGLVHRDISPDNIMIQSDGSAKLLDFGAVREVKDADVEKNLSRSTESILKHGYAPIEQYQRRGNLGPWTDIYALCATVYYCLTQKVPPDAPERMIEMVEIEWDKIEGLTEKQVEIFTHGMALFPKDRIISIAELRQALFTPEKKPEPVPPSIPERTPEPVPEQMAAEPQRPVSVWEQAGFKPTVIMLTPTAAEELPSLPKVPLRESSENQLPHKTPVPTADQRKQEELLKKKQELQRQEREKQEQQRLEQKKREQEKQEKRARELERREKEQRQRQQEQQRLEEEKQQRRQAQLERNRQRQARKQAEAEAQPQSVSKTEKKRKPMAILAALAAAAAITAGFFLLKPKGEATLQEPAGETVAETAAVEETAEADQPTLAPLTADDFRPEANAPVCTLVDSHYNGHGSDAFTYHARNNGNVLVIESQDLYITITDGKEVSVTVSGLEIQDSYQTNLPTSYASILEYGWFVYLVGEKTYSVGTSTYAFNPGETAEKTIGQMQKTLWEVEGSSSHYTQTPVGVQWTSDSITWTYTIPADHPFDFTKLKQVALHIENNVEDIHLCRVYNPDTGAEKSTAAAEKTRFAYMPAENPTYAPDAWKNNVMMEAPFDNNEINNIIESVTSVIFLDTIAQTPADRWDVSHKQDGSVLAWRYGNELYIGAEGGINAGTSCEYLFNRFFNLKSVYFNGFFHTDDVTNMNGIFLGCNQLQYLDLSSLNTSKVTNMNYMFNGCEKLTTLDLSNFDTSMVTEMIGMFSGCKLLSELDLSGFNTSKVTNMGSMFMNCSSLRSLNISSWNTANVSYMHSLFKNCSSLTKLELRNFKINSATMTSEMFSGCSSLTELDLSSFTGGNLQYMDKMFSDCTKLKTLTFGDINTSRVHSMQYMFSNCIGLTKLDLNNWDTSKLLYTYGMFLNCKSLKEVHIDKWKTGQIRFMNHMFSGCEQLEYLDISGWNTYYVRKMHHMFNGCTSLKELDLSKWNTGKVLDMNNMFSGCTGLTKLNLSGWKNTELTDTSDMFRGCVNLTALDVSNWNTKAVITMSRMFSGCTKLGKIDVSSWNTDKVAFCEGFMDSGKTVNGQPWEQLFPTALSISGVEKATPCTLDHTGLQNTKNYAFQTYEVGNALHMEGENLHIAVRYDTSSDITISNLTILDSYPVGTGNAEWMICFYGNNMLVVSTSNGNFTTNENSTEQLSNLTTQMRKTPSSYEYIGGTEISGYTDNSLTWDCDTRNYEEFDFGTVDHIVVHVKDPYTNTYLCYNYMLQ